MRKFFGCNYVYKTSQLARYAQVILIIRNSKLSYSIFTLILFPIYYNMNNLKIAHKTEINLIYFYKGLDTMVKPV